MNCETKTSGTGAYLAHFYAHFIIKKGNTPKSVTKTILHCIYKFSHLLPVSVLTDFEIL